MPVDGLLDAAEATVSLGARNLCCRINATAKSFGRSVEQLKHAAQLFLGESLLREVVEGEGRQVLASSESGALKPQWQARDCTVKTPAGQEVSRVYLGIDGFTVPILTEQEKCKRRQKVVAARAKRSADKPQLPPLPRRKKGADERYKEFKLVQFHDETLKHRLVSVTRKPCQEAARIMRRDGRRIGFEQADERLGNVDGGSSPRRHPHGACAQEPHQAVDRRHVSDDVGQHDRQNDRQHASIDGQNGRPVDGQVGRPLDR